MRFVLKMSTGSLWGWEKHWAGLWCEIISKFNTLNILTLRDKYVQINCSPNEQWMSRECGRRPFLHTYYFILVGQIYAKWLSYTFWQLLFTVWIFFISAICITVIEMPRIHRQGGGGGHENDELRVPCRYTFQKVWENTIRHLTFPHMQLFHAAVYSKFRKDGCHL